MKKKCAFIGYRGMVGQVLWQRLLEENDFARFSWCLAGSSEKGQSLELAVKHLPPQADFLFSTIQDSHDLETLGQMDIILTCQGSDYSEKIYPMLKKRGWSGYWIDAASAFRGDPEATLLLDPLNEKALYQAIKNEKKVFVGANCTVSLLLLALKGLLEQDAIDWITSMTYQAASGAGAAAIDELFGQMKTLGSLAEDKDLSAKNLSALERCQKARDIGMNFDSPAFKTLLAGNVLPWIDSELPNGQSREEAKAASEASKILGRPLAIDGTCVRVPGLRVHAQALTIQLKKHYPLAEIETLLREAHPWIKIVPNDRESTLKMLHPLAVSGTLDIHVGRMRYLNAGKNMLNIFTMGDQLLWGAAEPLRRFLTMLT